VQRYREVAALGVTTRSPSKIGVTERGLPYVVRAQGQIVVEVAKGSAAEKAGINKGDIIFTFGKNKVYSQDDLKDYLAIRKPGDSVALKVQRAKSDKREDVTLRLGSRRCKAPHGPELRWQYAGLGQLPAALKDAKKQDKLLLVGLSGAET
jgi:S1-C subfamily serine protease